jgi:hypothetical protein
MHDRTSRLLAVLAALVTGAALLVAGPVTPASAGTADDGWRLAPPAVVAGGGGGWGGPLSGLRLPRDMDWVASPSANGGTWLVRGPSAVRYTAPGVPVATVDLDHAGVDVESSGGDAWVLTERQLLRVDATGAQLRQLTLPLGTPKALALTAAGTPVVAFASAIYRLDGDRFVLHVPPVTWTSIVDVAVGPSDETFVSVSGAGVYRIPASGDRSPVQVVGNGKGSRQLPTGDSPTPAALFPYNSSRIAVVPGPGPNAGELWISGSMDSESDVAAFRVTGSMVELMVTGPSGCESPAVMRAGAGGRLSCYDRATRLSTLHEIRPAAVGSRRSAYVLAPALNETNPNRDSLDGAPATEAYFGEVRDATRTPDGRTWIATGAGLRWVDASGALRSLDGAGLPTPGTVRSIAMAGQDVVAAAGSRVVRIGVDSDGRATVTDLGAGWVDARDVAVDGVDILVADAGRLAVFRVATNGAMTKALDGMAFTGVAANARGFAGGGPEGLIEMSGGVRRTLATRSIPNLGAWNDRWLVTDPNVVYDVRPDGGIGVVVGANTWGVHRADGAGRTVLVVDAHRVMEAIDPQPSPVPDPPTGLAAIGRAGFIEMAWDRAGSDDTELRRLEAEPQTTGWDRSRGACGGPIRGEGTSVPKGGPVLVRVWCEPSADDGLVVPGVTYSPSVVRREITATGADYVAEVWSAPAVGAPVIALPDDGPPPAPTITRVTAGRFQVSVSWSPADQPDVVDFEHYVLRYREGSVPPSSATDGEGVPVNHGGAFTSDLKPDTDYTFALFAVDARRNASSTTFGPLRLDTVGPGPVSGLSVVPSEYTADISWVPPSDVDFKGVVLDVASRGEPAPETSLTCSRATLARDLTSITLPLLPARDYTAWVRTCDLNGNAGPLTSLDFTSLRDDIPPGAARDLDVVVSGQQVTATWQRPADSDLSSVRLRMTTLPDVPRDPDDGIGTLVGKSGLTSATFPRVAGGTAYNVVAFSIDKAGNWTATEPVPVTTEPDTTAPRLPAGWSVTPRADRTVMVIGNRDPAADDIAGFHVTLVRGGSATADSAGGLLPATKCVFVTGSCLLTVSVPAYYEQYTVALWPYDFSGNVGAAQAKTFTIADPQLPSSPTGLAVVPHGQNNLRVTWAGATDGSTAAGVVVDYLAEVRQQGRVVASVRAGKRDARSLDVANLLGGAPVEVQLFAVSSGGRSAVPAKGSATPADGTAPTRIPHMSVVGGTRTASVSWTRSASFDVRHYVVRWARGRAAPVSPTSGAGVTTSALSTRLVSLPAGSDVSIAIFPVDWAGNVGAARTYIVNGTRVSMTAPRTVTYGSTATLRGKLMRADGQPGMREKIVLQRRATGSRGSWTTLATILTSSAGNWSHSFKPSAHTDIRAVFPGTTGHIGAETAGRQRVALRVTASANSSVRYGARISVSGKVAPAAKRKVTLQRYHRGAWRTLTTSTTTKSGSYKFSTKLSRGTWSLRVVATGDSARGTAASPTRKVRVR